MFFNWWNCFITNDMIANHTFQFSSIIPDVTQKFAKYNALSFVDETPITYAEMGNKISALTLFLEKLKVKSGEKVIIYSQNMPNWGIVYFTLQCMGIVVVPVLPDFSSLELQNVISHSEAKAIFISKSLESRLSEIEHNNLEIIVRIDNFEVLNTNSVSVEFNENEKSSTVYNTDENALAILLYTSGTTGNSKGVMLSQKNVIYNAHQSDKIQEILTGDKFLSVLPLSHTYENTIGLILPILKGACVYYLKKLPTASVLLPAMAKIKPDIMLTVPLIIEKVFKSSILPTINSKPITKALNKFRPTQKLLYRIAGKKLYQSFGGKLKFFGIGGAKLDGKVEQFLIDAKFPYAIGYGLTETAPLLAGAAPFQTKWQAIGPKVVETEVIIHNPDPVTGEGEIWARGENIMLGYYKNDVSTKEVLTDDGWFKTGDLGVYDKQGWLSHKGRLKNLIVGANGENIYPEEIESLINNFRHVVESIVIEKKGKLVAMVHFDREELEQKVRAMRKEFSSRVDERIEEISNRVDLKIEEINQRIDEIIAELVRELELYVNSRVNKFSKIQMLIVSNDPFQKTATKKIKRYLYY